METKDSRVDCLQALNSNTQNETPINAIPVDQEPFSNGTITATEPQQ